jgi:hypothetical protein
MTAANPIAWTCANCGKGGKDRYRLPWYKAALMSVVLLAPIWGDICEACRDKLDTVFLGVVVAVTTVAVVATFVVLSKLA